MKLYEVICHGAHGRGDDADTIYLVRAPDFRTAVEQVTTNASLKHHGGNTAFPHVVYEIGTDLSLHPENHPRILRGPYFQCAYNRGWRAWYRKIEGSEYTKDWQEETNENPFTA